MRRTYKYRAKLSKTVERKAEEQLRLCCELYNAAIEERIRAYGGAVRGFSARFPKLSKDNDLPDPYADKRVSVGFYSASGDKSRGQSSQLPAIKKVRPEFREVCAQSLQDVLKRVDLAFQHFFRRVKNGEKPGFPRFKSVNYYKSLTFTQFNASWRFVGSRHINLTRLGSVKLFYHREIEGKPKTCTLKRDAAGDWWIFISCEEVPVRPMPDTGKQVGLDLGLAAFIATSDDEFVSNPRLLRRSEAELKRTQRRLSKRKRGGSRRNKMRRVLARRWRHVDNARRDFHFKAARDLVEQYDRIAVEDLNVKGLARGMLAKSVHDAGWAQFISILKSKAEEAGREVVEVDPRGTSQVCSGCGVEPEERKTLRVRTHRCLHCGLELDRDLNAARNVLHLMLNDGDTRGRAVPLAS